MGKLDVSLVQYLDKSEFKVLSAVEQGMKTHELVPLPHVTKTARLRFGGTSKILRQSLGEKKLVRYERGPRYDGYRLTNLGYDYLAVKKLSVDRHLGAVGNQIGVGKESDIFVVQDVEGKRICMKLHRLGRTCFRKLKEKRDYHRGKQLSWIFLSRVSATKEFAFMAALHERGFPVPKPLATDRHVVLMELVDGVLLQNVSEIGDAGQLYEDLMQLIVEFADNGVIHGDFNEFNIMVKPDSKPVIIDFPQMISTSHKNAKVLFERDVECVRTFFKRRFNYESENHPVFDKDVERTFSLDLQVKASGFDKDIDFDIADLDPVPEDEEDSDDDNSDDSDDDTYCEDINSVDGNDDDCAGVSPCESGDEDTKSSDEVSDAESDTHKNSMKDDKINAQDNQNKDCDNKSNVKVEASALEDSLKDDDNMSALKLDALTLKDLSKDVDNKNCAKTDSAEESKPSPAFNATMEMYFRSLKDENPEMARTLNSVPEDAVCNDAPTFVNLPTVDNHTADNFDTLSTASKRSRRNRYNENRYSPSERKAIIARINKAGEQQRQARANGEEVPTLEELVNADVDNEDDRVSFSLSTAATSVAASRRIKKERQAREQREMPKKYLRTKGDAHAAKRRSKECATEISSTMECKDVWG